MGRILLGIGLLLMLVTAVPTPALSANETRLVVRNLGARPRRVQVSLGSVMPCDSTENRQVWDGFVGGNTTQMIGLGSAINACVRYTSPGSGIDFGPSFILPGGRRCRRGTPCLADTSQVLRLDMQE
jgi:hypothetical protein